MLQVALGLRQPAGGRARCDTSRVGYIAQNAANWCIDDRVLDQLATLSPGERVSAALIGHSR